MIKAKLGSPGTGMQFYVPPAVENAAVPVVTTPTGAGHSVGHPVTSFHVVGCHAPIHQERQFETPDLGVGRGDYWPRSHGCLDAPAWLPSGSARALGGHCPLDTGRFAQRG